MILMGHKKSLKSYNINVFFHYHLSIYAQKNSPKRLNVNLSKWIKNNPPKIQTSIIETVLDLIITQS